MSVSPGAPRPDDPLTDPLADPLTDYPSDYRDPLTTTTDDYVGTGEATTAGSASTYASSGAHAVPVAGGYDTSGGSGTAGTAKDEAARVGGEAKASGAHVAGVAKDEAAGVAQEAKAQAKGLLSQGRSEVSSQATAQQQRAAGGLRGLGDQLSGLAGGSPQPGLATDLAQQASDQVAKVAQWLESREPADLLSEAQRFARRRPGAFLAIAAGVGLLAGRLTRGIAAEVREEKEVDRLGTGGTGSAYATSTPATTDRVTDPYAEAVPYGDGDPYARTAPSGALPAATTTTSDLGYATGPSRTGL